MVMVKKVKMIENINLWRNCLYGYEWILFGSIRENISTNILGLERNPWTIP